MAAINLKFMCNWPINASFCQPRDEYIHNNRVESGTLFTLNLGLGIRSCEQNDKCPSFQMRIYYEKGCN
jgi:hypothetical protein